MKYVVELAKALGRLPAVARVDLLTRLVADPAVSSDYAVPQERLVRLLMPAAQPVRGAARTTLLLSSSVHLLLWL